MNFILACKRGACVCARVYKFISKIVSAVQYQRQHLLLFQRNSLQKIDVSISHSTGRIFIHESVENCARRRLDTPRPTELPNLTASRAR